MGGVQTVRQSGSNHSFPYRIMMCHAIVCRDWSDRIGLGHVITVYLLSHPHSNYHPHFHSLSHSLSVLPLPNLFVTFTITHSFPQSLPLSLTCLCVTGQKNTTRQSSHSISVILFIFLLRKFPILASHEASAESFSRVSPVKIMNVRGILLLRISIC